MNKLLLKTMFIATTFLIAVGVSAFVIKGLMSVFFAFLLSSFLISAAYYTFIKAPIKCEQTGCNGIASPEVSPEVKDLFLRHFLIIGHKCASCGHLMKNSTKKKSRALKS